MTRPRGMVAAAVSAAALMLAACSSTSGTTGSTGSSGAAIQLTMWQQWGGGHEEDTLKSIIARYEKLHPNITIVETPVTNNAKILAAIAGGNPPDIVDLGTSLALGGWASQGAVLPLDSMIKSSGLDTSLYVPAGLKAATVGSSIYALPFQNFNIGLLYNKKLFTDAGLDPNKPPTTLEELTADAAKLTKVSNGTITQMGFVPNYPGPDQGQVCPLESYGWLFGGDWFDSSGKPAPDSPQTVAALAWEKSFYDTYGAQKMSNFVHSAGQYLTSGDPFASGKLAMMFDGPWSLQYVKANNAALANDIGVEKFPAPAAMPQNAGTSFLDTNPQLIPKGAKNPQAAFDFIKWMTTNPDVTAEFSNLVANLPQLNTVPSFPVETDPRFQVYEAEAKSSAAHTWPQSATSSQYGTQLCQAQDSSLLKGVAPSTALQTLAAAVH